MEADILITGKDGQLGRAFVSLLGDKAIALGRQELDMRDADFAQKFAALLQEKKIRAVINAAAYTQVDKAEGEGLEEAFQVNGKAPVDMAAACKRHGIPLVHFSTDYVFDGSGDAPWKEKDETNPINAYGTSKQAGEWGITKVGGQHLIFRTSWIYDAHGANFFNTMLRLFEEKDSLKVVADQVGAPTYAPHLALGAWQALEVALGKEFFPSGVYHLCSGGETSWYGFAQAIFRLAQDRTSGVRCERIDPIPSSGYPTPARRPLNSRLDCLRAKTVFGVALPSWQQGLNECFEEKYGRTRLQNSGT